MKHLYIISFLLFSFTACDDSAVDAIGAGASSNTLIHYQGQNCATCHNGGDANATAAASFQTGGTLFDLIDSSNDSAGFDLSTYIVRLKNYDTFHTVNMTETTNGTGNFYTTETLADDNYTIEILSGTTVINSASNHGASRLECHSCHTSSGTGGTKGRIVESVNLSKDVTPNICNACHALNYAYAGKNTFLSYTTNGHSGSTAVSTSSTEYKDAYEWVREGSRDD